MSFFTPKDVMRVIVELLLSNISKMRQLSRKKYYRHSTSFYRKVKRHLANNGLINDSSGICEKILLSDVQHYETSNFPDTFAEPDSLPATDFFIKSTCDNNPILETEPEDIEFEPEDMEIVEQMEKHARLVEELRLWALHHNIPHSAINNLLQILNECDMKLPKDSRTLLETPKSVNVTSLANGKYWYHGIKANLSVVFKETDTDVTCSLVFNIDGLPIYNSSTLQLWPILFTIQEYPCLPPMPISIFCGNSKPTLTNFLLPFVEELDILTKIGMFVNKHKISINIKYFVCDTPARSFIKGVAGFNSYHGCIKCTIIGDYDKQGRHMSFPRTDCRRRTDRDFRNKEDPDHHKEDTLLTKLSINMVDDFVTADSLHLLHLGKKFSEDSSKKN